MSVSDGRGRAVPDGGLARWLVRVAPSAARGELAIALVSDARMRALNRQFRRKDYATDVLSFPASTSGDRTPGSVARQLGDLVIATGVARRQAREAGHSFQAELRVLALHGLLHILGYDHERRSDRGRMARAESRLRRNGGLGSGLLERQGPPSEATLRQAQGRPEQGRRATAARPKAARARRARTRAGVEPREP